MKNSAAVPSAAIHFSDLKNHVFPPSLLSVVFFKNKTKQKKNLTALSSLFPLGHLVLILPPYAYICTWSQFLKEIHPSLLPSLLVLSV